MTDRGRQTCTEGRTQETLKGHKRAWKSNTRHHKTQNHDNNMGPLNKLQAWWEKSLSRSIIYSHLCR